MIRHAGRVLTFVLGAAVLWAPLPFGSVTPEAATALWIAGFLCLALAMLAIARPGDLAAAAPPALALAAVACLGLLQSASWPAPVARLLSPEHARLGRQAADLLAATNDLAAPADVASDRLQPPIAQPTGSDGAGGAAGESGAGDEGEDGAGGARRAASVPLSVAPSASREAALTWAALAAWLLAAAAAGQERLRRRALAAAVVASALFQAVFGARGWFARSASIWGLPVPGSVLRLRGTFVNPNHLALFLEMALAIAFAWAWWAVIHLPDEPRPERRVLLVAPPLLAWLALFAALVFTGSRGGLAAALVGAATQGLLLSRRRSWAPLGVLVPLAGLAVAAALGKQEGLGRLLATSAQEISWTARRQAYGAVVALWRQFPWTGCGLGAFRDAFPLVQPAAVGGSWWHAQSDWLELPATVGLLGAALVLAGLFLLLRRLDVVLRLGRRSEDRGAALAALGALAAVVLHETVDFGLSMPANAVTLVVILGAAVTARTVAAGTTMERRRR